jgi:chromosome segregation ATPase
MNNTLSIDLANGNAKWHSVDGKRILKIKHVNIDPQTRNMIEKTKQLEQMVTYQRQTIDKINLEKAQMGSEINALKNTNVQIRNQINALRMELNSIKNTNETYKANNAKLVEEKTSLINQISKLSSELVSLRAVQTQYIEIQQKHMKSEISYGTIIIKNNKLELKLDDEIKKSNIIAEKYEELLRRNIELEEEIKKNKIVAEQYESFIQENAKLKDEINKINKQNKKLSQSIEHIVFSSIVALDK